LDFGITCKTLVTLNCPEQRNALLLTLLLELNQVLQNMGGSDATVKITLFNSYMFAFSDSRISVSYFFNICMLKFEVKI